MAVNMPYDSFRTASDSSSVVCGKDDSKKVDTDQQNELSIVQDEHQEDKVSEKSKNHVKYEDTYLIDNEIEVRFFNNQKFLAYFIDYVQHETFHTEIKIDSENDQSSISYTIKLTGTKHQNQVARSFIKYLLKSIKVKTYNWMYRFKPNRIIQNILDNETELFTVCQLYFTKLEIYYFDNEKFNPSTNLIKINHIIQNQIAQEKILWRSIDNRHTVELIGSISWKYQIGETKQFFEEFKEILNQYKHDHSLVSITVNLDYRSRTDITNRPIEIFGDKNQVNEILQKFKDLFDKHRLRKFRFSQLSSTEVSLHFGV